jgi:DNA-directed RNA polymerase, mitochondrial
VTDAKDEPEMEIPFNLENLRKHLAQLQLARRVLPEDVTARQTLLEASVHEVAIERFRHEDAILKQLGLGNTLHQRNLQAWMWTWHQALEARLVSTIKDIVSAEQSPNWRPSKRFTDFSILIALNHPILSSKNSDSPRTISVAREG